MEKPSIKQLEENILGERDKSKDMFLSEDRQRRLDILNEVAGGKIWLLYGWINVKGRRVRCHSRTSSVRLERFIKQLKEMDERVRNRIVYNGSLRFLINSEVKNEIIERNLWGAKKNRGTFFGKEEDEGKVMRFYFPITSCKPLNVGGLIRKMEKLKNLKI